MPEKSPFPTQKSLFNHPESTHHNSKFIAAYRVMLVRDEHLAFENSKLSNSREAQAIIRKVIKTYGQSDKEKFCVALLNNKNEVIGLNIVSIGAVSFAHVHPRKVLKPAILVSASAIILAHNHPSENVSPYREDESITARIIKAAHIIGIKVHEHLIISIWGERYFSFTDKIQDIYGFPDEGDLISLHSWNDELERRGEDYTIAVCTPPLSKEDRLEPFIQIIRDRTQPGKKSLHLGDNSVLAQRLLELPSADAIIGLRAKDYPAVAAAGFALMALSICRPERQRLPESYLTDEDGDFFN